MLSGTSVKKALHVKFGEFRKKSITGNFNWKQYNLMAVIIRCMFGSYTISNYWLIKKNEILHRRNALHWIVNDECFALDVAQFIWIIKYLASALKYNLYSYVKFIKKIVKQPKTTLWRRRPKPLETRDDVVDRGVRSIDRPS